MPSAAMTPPPGTPGAATMVMPSMKIYGVKRERLTSIPMAIMIPIVPRTRQIVSPARWMVAHKGMQKFVTSSEILLLRAHFKLTGMVEAEDWVPTAVK